VKTEQSKDETMKFSYGLAPALMGITLVLLEIPAAIALSKTQVNEIAKQITVLIRGQKGYGSGTLVHKAGNTYTVLTAAHVVSVKDDYQILTPNGKSYRVNDKNIKQLQNVDLAVVQFRSPENYTVAKIGNSESIKEGTTIYIAGFPAPTYALPNPIYTFRSGEVNANASKPLRDGYGLVYISDTSEGMSGGPVLNEKGELVGIHGRASKNKDTEQTNTGFNLGIGINTFLRLSAKIGVNAGVPAFSTQAATAPKADDFFVQALNKYEKGDKQGMLADLNSALKINPNNAAAYNNRGLVRYQLGDMQGALADFNTALKINPNNAAAYNGRGLVRSQLGDKQGALADFNTALKINPNNAAVYLNRGFFRSRLGDKQGGIADIQKGFELLEQQAITTNNQRVLQLMRKLRF
jgi:tetratricopeptide (TPR) repeat protein